ncbi:MAG: hypothetical protein MJK08_04920 [Campylobacterales bacterium]|nr:hypothetical protein [Campylobacterales bacterium]
MNTQNIKTYTTCSELFDNDFFKSSYFTRINNKKNIHIQETSFYEFFKAEKNIKINTSSLYNCDLSMIKKIKKLVIVFQGDRVDQYQLSYDLLNDIKQYANKDLELLLGYYYSPNPTVTLIYT